MKLKDLINESFMKYAKNPSKIKTASKLQKTVENFIKEWNIQDLPVQIDLFGKPGDYDKEMKRAKTLIKTHEVIQLHTNEKYNDWKGVFKINLQMEPKQTDDYGDMVRSMGSLD